MCHDNQSDFFLTAKPLRVLVQRKVSKSNLSFDVRIPLDWRKEVFSNEITTHLERHIHHQWEKNSFTATFKHFVSPFTIEKLKPKTVIKRISSNLHSCKAENYKELCPPSNFLFPHTDRNREVNKSL